MYDTLHEARKKWRIIGRKLSIERSILGNIEAEHSNNDRCLEEMISTFLKRRSPNPTWQVVINALKHKVVAEGALAEELEKKYSSELTPIRECLFVWCQYGTVKLPAYKFP